METTELYDLIFRDGDIVPIPSTPENSDKKRYPYAVIGSDSQSPVPAKGCLCEFSINPRPSSGKGWDESCQIKTIRNLCVRVTCDLDTLQARITEQQIPSPTAMITAGQGCYALWSLAEALQVAAIEFPLYRVRNKRGLRLDPAGETKASRSDTSLSQLALSANMTAAGLAKALDGTTVTIDGYIPMPGSRTRDIVTDEIVDVKLEAISFGEYARFEDLQKFELKLESKPEPSESIWSASPGVSQSNIPDNAVVYDSRALDDSYVEDALAIMAKSGNFYNRAGKIVCIRGDNGDKAITPIGNSGELRGALHGKLKFITKKHTKEETYLELGPISTNHGDVILNCDQVQTLLPEIKSTTFAPVFDENWKLLEPGYNADSKRYYDGPEVIPVEGTNHIDHLISGFAFETNSDRTNYISQLLTIFVKDMLSGEKPMATIIGNKVGVGKSTAAKAIAYICDGREEASLDLSQADENETAKSLGANIAVGVQTIIFDNVRLKLGSWNEVGHPVIEKCLTDKLLQFRRLQTSTLIKAPNTFMWAMTANTTGFGSDIASRSCFVSLNYEDGAVDTREFKFDVRDYTIEHRQQILGELYSMWLKWLSAGKPLAKPTSRYNRWSQIVGGVLEVNGYTEFMDNYRRMSSRLSAKNQDFDDFLRVLLDRYEDEKRLQAYPSWSALDLAKVLRKQRAFAKSFESSMNNRRLGEAAGTVLTEFIGVPFDIDETKVILRKKKTKECNAYYLAFPLATGEESRSRPEYDGQDVIPWPAGASDDDLRWAEAT